MSRWQRTLDHRGIERWESDLGTAYNKGCPPERDPLTAEQVKALPSGTRILVLWGGGNGPHEYEWRDGMIYIPGYERDNGHRLGGLIGDWGLVGAQPHMDKVWLPGGEG